MAFDLVVRRCWGADEIAISRFERATAQADDPDDGHKLASCNSGHLIRPSDSRAFLNLECISYYTYSHYIHSKVSPSIRQSESFMRYHES
jgi:hypothetical protein